MESIAGVTCVDLDEPIVVVSNIVRDMYGNMFGNLRGLYYRNEPYIFVKAGMAPSATKIVTLHEITHYVLFFNGITEKCLSEEIAREVAGQDPDEWRERYGCLQDDTLGNEASTT